MTTEAFSSSSTEINVEVTVFDVGRGGNSPSGRFLILFSHDVVHVSARDTAINYTLCAQTAGSIAFVGYFATDSNAQLKPVPGSEVSELHSSRSIRLIHKNNTEPLMVGVSLQFYDSKTKVRGAMDPQVTNTPSPH